MDLHEMIEQTRFLGRELLVWMWWKSDLFEGRMDVTGHGECEVWIDDQITLEAAGAKVERSQLRGTSPAASPEAREALRQGKVPTKARISITLPGVARTSETRGGKAERRTTRKDPDPVPEEREFGFVLHAETLALSSVKTPALLQDEIEERFYERMYLLEELDSVLRALVAEFFRLRVSRNWDTEFAPAIRAWVRDEPGMTRQRYLALVGG
jgi:hypothetical protein